MKRFKLILLLLPLFNVQAHSQQLKGLPFSNYYSSSEYKGGIQNWAITQNAEGLIYVANNFGLLEYDGTSWNRYDLPSATKLRDVVIGRNGKIYVASQGDFGYFMPNQMGNSSFISLADSLPSQHRNFDETWRIFKNNELLIFCTFNEIFVYKNDRFIKAVTPQYASENFHFVNNTLFINQLQVGLSYLKGDSLVTFDKGEFFKGKAITGIIPLVNNHLLISTLDDGIFTYNGLKYEVWIPKNNPQFILSSVNNILQLRNGNIAVGTQNNGLLIMEADGEIIYSLNKDHGLGNRTILSMYEDMLGNLWLGHNNGITNIELALPFTLISEQIGLPGTGYDGLIYGNDIYLGTNNGLYTKSLSSEDKVPYQFINNTEGQVYNISNVDNALLLGHHKGSFEIGDGKADQISDILGAWTFLKLENHPGYVLGGTYKGLLLYKREGNTLKYVRKINGFNESSRVMELDDEGNIWMTHGYKGVYRLTLNQSLDSVRMKYYGKEAGLPSNILINVWKLNNQLVFSSESQVYKYDPLSDRFVIDDFFKAFFPPGSRLSFLEQDPMGNIYYISPNDIGVLLKKPNGTYEKKSRIFNRLKSLLNDDLQNLSVLNNNLVLYGAKEGFILYSKEINNLATTPFQTLIRKVTNTSVRDSIISVGYYLKNNNITAEQPEKQTLSYDLNSIRIEFSAPFYHSSHQTNYQYMLEGIDNTWSKWTTKTDKEYTNLNEGTYTFKVHAKNIYDQISSEAMYSFVVLPPWYKTSTAYFIYTLSVISILAGVFYLLEHRHKKEKKLMTVKQKREIIRIDSELKSTEEEVQQLKNEKLLAQVEIKNRELSTSTGHLLNKNSFINSVKHNISTIIKKSKNKEVQHELSKIMSNIDKNISQDKDWEKFAIHFDEVHGGFTTKIQEKYPNLTPQEMKLSVYLRMNLSSKEIAHLLNISLRGVEIARYRLRKKLSLDRANNLQDFILKF
jgi:ligand-binding sensor domain-containing protein/DNA-binding CsgD family transcriptional regulator